MQRAVLGQHRLGALAVTVIGGPFGLVLPAAIAQVMGQLPAHGTAEGDALHTVLCAAGYNLRWLMRAVRRLGLRGLSAVLTRVLGLWLSAGISRSHGPKLTAS